MNRVGHEGRGESVWLGFFIYTVLSDFVPICESRGERELAAPVSRDHAAPRARGSRRRGTANGTGAATTMMAGRWDRRRTTSAQIDSISQSWAMLSGAVPRRFAERALDAVRASPGRPAVAHPAAADAAVRQVGSGSRLHQGLSAGHPRERRPVHARRGVGADGDCQAGQRRRGRRAVPHAQPDQPHAHAART